MRTQKAKQIPIIDLLAKMGYNPKNTRGVDFWYLSPLRREDTPSFKVDTRQNLWYDHGSKQGGGIIDLVMVIHNLTVSEALQELQNFVGGSILKYSPIQPYEAKNDLKNEDNTEDTIKSIKPLNNKALIEYLQSRNTTRYAKTWFSTTIRFPLLQSK